MVTVCLVLALLFGVVLAQHIPEHQPDCDQHSSYEECYKHRSNICAWCNLTYECFFYCDKNARTLCPGGIERLTRDKCVTTWVPAILGMILIGTILLGAMGVLCYLAYRRIRRCLNKRTPYRTIN